jgi:hypothetical protein
MGLRSSEGLVFYLGVTLRSFSPFVRDSNHPCDEERAGWGILFGERKRVKLCSSFVTSHHLLSASFNIEESNEMVKVML